MGHSKILQFVPVDGKPSQEPLSEFERRKQNIIGNDKNGN